jgi:hypothetical protein
MAQQPPIVENDAGDRMAWNGRAWVNIGNKNAPGARWLEATPGAPDKSEAAYFNKWRTDDNTRVNSARTGIARARRMEGLLAKQKTGGLYAVPVVGSVMGMFDPEVREMDAIQSEVARTKRVPGEGAVSDFDAKQFLAMTYGKDKPTETNRALIQAQRLGDDAAIQRRQFMEWHYNTFGKASGAEEAWDLYAQDNPIFLPSSEASGAPALNNRRQGWREYFGVSRGGKPSQAEEDLRRSSAKRGDWTDSRKPAEVLSPAQRKTVAMFRGAKAERGSKGNPFVPYTKQQFDRLKPGEYYIDTDGRIFQKGAR